MAASMAAVLTAVLAVESAVVMGTEMADAVADMLASVLTNYVAVVKISTASNCCFRCVALIALVATGAAAVVQPLFWLLNQLL